MIQFSLLWTFRSYCSANGDEVRGWYDGAPAAVRAELDLVALYLASLDAQAWDESINDYKNLKGKLSTLGELRIVAGDEHHRVLGFRDDKAMEFTMLYAGRKTKIAGDFYRLHGPTALARKAEIDTDRLKFSCAADWILLS